jgi:hypothetical protein
VPIEKLPLVQEQVEIARIGVLQVHITRLKKFHIAHQKKKKKKKKKKRNAHAKQSNHLTPMPNGALVSLTERKKVINVVFSVFFFFFFFVDRTRNCA